MFERKDRRRREEEREEEREGESLFWYRARAIWQNDLLL